MKKITALTIALIIAITSFTTAIGAEAAYVDEYSITVNKSTNCVTVYQKDTTGNLTPVKAMICSVGKYKDSTPNGSFKTKNKYRWRLLFGDVYGQYATRINGHILFHSVYYKTTDPSTLKTEEYNKLGTSASAGCIRLTVADAKWIYDNCRLGTTVNIIESGTDPLPRPEAIKMTVNTTYPNWDPTDPDPDNPWKKEGVKIKINTPPKQVKASDAISSEALTKLLTDNIIAYDSANNIIEYEISCNISTVTPGVYPVKYYARDCLGNYIERYTTFIVLDE